MSNRTIIAVGAGATGIPEVDFAAERARWDVAEQTWGPGVRHVVPGAWDKIQAFRARPDGWAVVVEARRGLADELDENGAVDSWDFLPSRPAARRTGPLLDSTGGA